MHEGENNSRESNFQFWLIAKGEETKGNLGVEKTVRALKHRTSS